MVGDPGQHVVERLSGPEPDNFLAGISLKLVNVLPDFGEVPAGVKVCHRSNVLSLLKHEKEHCGGVLPTRQGKHVLH